MLFFILHLKVILFKTQLLFSLAPLYKILNIQICQNS